MTTSPKNKPTGQTSQKQASVTKRTERSGASSKEILAELKQVRAAVENSVAACARINLQISEGLSQQNLSIVSIAEAMRDVKAGLDNSQTTSGSATSFHPKQSFAAAEELTAEFPTETVSTNTGMKTGDWDDIRAAFLKDHTSEQSPDAAAEKSIEVAAESVSQEDVENDELDRLLEQLPSAVEPTSTDTDELQRAVIDRDRTISVLVRRLQKQNRSRQTMTPEQLASLTDGVPEELIARIEESLQAVNQQIRLGELELSLERARVSRQLAKIEETRERLESNARSLGLTIAEDGSIEGTSNAVAMQGSKGRRWLGVLGFGN